MFDRVTDRMKLLIFITPKEFKDESIATVKLFLEKWDVDYTITSYSSRPECVGNHGAIYKIGVNTNKVSVEDYNGVILIDGEGVELYKIYDFRPLLDLMLKFNDRKKSIIAINNAIKVPARANIIKGKKISTPDDQETKRLITLFHGVPSMQNMEIADNIITVRSSSDLEDAMQRILEHLGVT